MYDELMSYMLHNNYADMLCSVVKDVVHTPDHLRRLWTDSITRNNSSSLGNNSRARDGVLAHRSMDVNHNTRIGGFVGTRKLDRGRTKTPASSDRQLI
jgi:hypothetical protein